MEAVRVKRYGYIYEKIYDMSNLRRAYHEAKRDKGHYGEVIAISGNVDYYLRQIQDMLRNETYVISPDDYEVFTKDDKGKLRVIHKLDFFPHRIIQWAVMLQIQDILLANLTTDTYASLPRRGIHLASNNLKYALENDAKETQYCLKMDIKKFYPSINHEINKRLLERKFKSKNE